MSTVTTIIAAPAAVVRVFAAGQRGPAGPAGPQGEQGPPGDAEGIPGLSAYEVAVANGFVGDETAWLASLVGAAGADGADGAPGADGADAVVAGSTGNVQFNTSGSLDAESDFSYDKTTNTLSVPNLAVGSITGPNDTTGTGISVGTEGDARSLSLTPGEEAPTFVSGMSVAVMLHENNVKTVCGQNIKGSGDITVSATATSTTYDNTGSGLLATNVQDAIDELATATGSQANTRGSLWRFWDMLGSSPFRALTFGNGFSALNSTARYHTIECSSSVANSGGTVYSDNGLPASTYLLGPWSNYWTGVQIVKPYYGASDISLVYGIHDSASAAAPSKHIGVEYSLANGFEIVFRYGGTDLQTRKPFTVTSGEILIIKTYFEVDSGQTAVTLARVEVRSFTTGALIESDEWTGSTAFSNFNHRIRAYKVGASSSREFINTTLYIGDGFNVPPTLAFA